MMHLHRHRQRVLGLTGLGVLLLGAASAGAQDAVAARLEGGPTSVGPALYAKYCAVCHGDKGDGQSRASRALNPAPRDFTGARARAELSRERMLTSVTHGRPGTAMVGWGQRLSEVEIAAVVDYIRDSFIQVDRDIPRGERIYRQHCAVCHGDGGNGAQWTEASLNPPPRDFTAPGLARTLTRKKMIESVTHGRPGTAMMSFKNRLTPPQVESVVDYIRATFLQPIGSDHAKPGFDAADMTAPFPHGLVGDAEAGRRFFMDNCFVCHGRDGNGRGPRARFIRPPPRNFLAADSRLRLNRPALFEAISAGKAGTVMPAWARVLDSQQIADVAEFVLQAFILSHTEAGGPKKKAVIPTAPRLMAP